MTKINDFNITKLRTEEDFGFQKRIESETALLTVEADKPMVDSYLAALTAFDDALKSNDSNSQSAATIAADEQADAAWSGLNAQVKVMLNYPVAAVRATAEEASIIIRKYGNITSMAYHEEYGRMHNLLQDLAALGLEKQKQIYIDAWVAELKKQYDAFMSASTARTAEDALRITGLVKQSRTDADTAYHALTERVNALALINGEAAYAPFIAQVNVLIDQAKAMLSARSTRAAAKKDAKAGA